MKLYRIKRVCSLPVPLFAPLRAFSRCDSYKTGRPLIAYLFQLLVFLGAVTPSTLRAQTSSMACDVSAQKYPTFSKYCNDVALQIKEMLSSQLPKDNLIPAALSSDTQSLTVEDIAKLAPDIGPNIAEVVKNQIIGNLLAMISLPFGNCSEYKVGICWCGFLSFGLAEQARVPVQLLESTTHSFSSSLVLSAGPIDLLLTYFWQNNLSSLLTELGLEQTLARQPLTVSAQQAAAALNSIQQIRSKLPLNVAMRSGCAYGDSASDKISVNVSRTIVAGGLSSGLLGGLGGSVLGGVSSLGNIAGSAGSLVGGVSSLGSVAGSAGSVASGVSSLGSVAGSAAGSVSSLGSVAGSASSAAGSISSLGSVAGSAGSAVSGVSSLGGITGSVGSALGGLIPSDAAAILGSIGSLGPLVGGFSFSGLVGLEGFSSILIPKGFRRKSGPMEFRSESKFMFRTPGESRLCQLNPSICGAVDRSFTRVVKRGMQRVGIQDPLACEFMDIGTTHKEADGDHNVVSGVEEVFNLPNQARKRYDPACFRRGGGASYNFTGCIPNSDGFVDKSLVAMAQGADLACLSAPNSFYNFVNYGTFERTRNVRTVRFKNQTTDQMKGDRIRIFSGPPSLMEWQEKRSRAGKACAPVEWWPHELGIGRTGEVINTPIVAIHYKDIFTCTCGNPRGGFVVGPTGIVGIPRVPTRSGRQCRAELSS